jgi:ferredoxin
MKQGYTPLGKRRSNSTKSWMQKTGPKRKEEKRKNEPTRRHRGNDSLRSFASLGTSPLPPPFSISPSFPTVPKLGFVSSRGVVVSDSVYGAVGAPSRQLLCVRCLRCERECSVGLQNWSVLGSLKTFVP